MSTSVAIYQKTLAHFLAPIQEFLSDPSVSEVMINGFDEIFIERAGNLERTDARFDDPQALEAALRNVAQFVGKRMTPEEPSIEARLPDGSRVHIVQPPAARNGHCVAIRKFSEQKLDLPALIAAGALSPEAAEFLGFCVGLHKNTIVSGGTGSGKTTLLNCLSGLIPDGERILVLEDSSELQLQQEHVVSLEAQPADRHGRGGMSIRDLFRASLRMRPDRIVIGECRGGEALDMIQAMTSGHSGSLSTAHANTPLGALARLETMALMGGVDIPLFALRAQVASAVEVIIQIARFGDGSRRVTHVSEVIPLSESGDYQCVDLFRFESQGRDANGKIKGELKWTGAIPTFRDEVEAMGLADQIELTQELWKENEG